MRLAAAARVERRLARHQHQAAPLLQHHVRGARDQVVGVRVDDTPGSATKVFAALEEAGINVEYCYCFTEGGTAAAALKAPEEAVAVLEAAGFETITQGDIA